MPQHAHRPDDHARLCDLSHGEHMLLWAFRAAAFGAGDCHLVRRQFEAEKKALFDEVQRQAGAALAADRMVE